MAHHPLRDARLSLGLSQRDLEAAARVRDRTVTGYECRILSPIERDGTWKPDALRVASHVARAPEELWPPQELARWRQRRRPGGQPGRRGPLPNPRAKSTPMRQARHELDLTQAELAELADVRLAVVRRLEQEAIKPHRASGAWTQEAERIAVALAMSCEELWPPTDEERRAFEEVMALQWEERRHKAARLATLAALRQTIDKALSVLTPRHRYVIERRFGLGLPYNAGGPVEWRDATLLEVAAEMKSYRNQTLTRERIRQLEAKALRWLRRPEVNAELRAFVPGLKPGSLPPDRLATLRAMRGSDQKFDAWRRRNLYRPVAQDAPNLGGPGAKPPRTRAELAELSSRLRAHREPLRHHRVDHAMMSHVLWMLTTWRPLPYWHSVAEDRSAYHMRYVLQLHKTIAALERFRFVYGDGQPVHVDELEMVVALHVTQAHRDFAPDFDLASRRSIELRTREAAALAALLARWGDRQRGQAS